MRYEVRCRRCFRKIRDTYDIHQTLPRELCEPCKKKIQQSGNEDDANQRGLSFLQRNYRP